MAAQISKTLICNMALSRLGGAWEQTELTSYKDDDTRAGKLCRKFFDHIVRGVLSEPDIDWREATKYADCGAALTGDSLPDISDWEYAYQLPSDCLRVIGHTDEDGRTVKYAWERLGDKLLSDQDTSYIKYIWHLGDVAKYSAVLVEAVVVKLAWKLAIILAANRTLAKELLFEYKELALNDAKRFTSQQSYVDGEDGSSDFIEAGRS